MRQKMALGNSIEKNVPGWHRSGVIGVIQKRCDLTNIHIHSEKKKNCKTNMKMKFHKWSFVLNRESDFRSDFRHIGPCRCRAPLCYRCRPPDLVGQRLRRTKDTSETWSDQDLWQWMGCLGKNAVNTMGFIVLYLSIYIYTDTYIYTVLWCVPEKNTPP